MLSILSNALAVATGRRSAHWDAPDHFKVSRGPRNTIDMEREAAEQRHRAMRNVGMW